MCNKINTMHITNLYEYRTNNKKYNNKYAHYFKLIFTTCYIKSKHLRGFIATAKEVFYESVNNIFSFFTHRLRIQS